MKEISRRCEINSGSGMACGPVSIDLIAAEIEIEDEGKKLFLTMHWISEAPEDLYFEVTTKPIIGFYLNPESNLDELDAIQKTAIESHSTVSDSWYDGQYRKQYRSLNDMIRVKRVEEGLFPDDEDEYDIDPPELETLEGNCRFCTDSVNWDVWEFTDEFRLEVFEKAKEKLPEWEDSWNLPNNYEELCELLDITDEEGEITIPERSSGYGRDFSNIDGNAVVEMLEELGYSVRFRGTKSRIMTIGALIVW